MATSKATLKELVYQNKEIISDMLSLSSTWISYHQWVQNQLLKENEVLLPQDKSYLYHCKEQKFRKNCLATSFNYITKNIKKIGTIDCPQIRIIHQLISKGSDVSGGAIRLGSVDLTSLNINAPNTMGIYYRMEELLCNLSHQDTDPLTQAFQTHYDIVAIQPFEDLNKRTARTIMNWILLKNGFTPLLFNKAGDRDIYLEAIRCKNCGTKKEYEKTFLNVMIRTQQRTISQLSKIQRREK